MFVGWIVGRGIYFSVHWWTERAVEHSVVVSNSAPWTGVWFCFQHHGERGFFLAVEFCFQHHKQRLCFPAVKCCFRHHGQRMSSPSDVLLAFNPLAWIVFTSVASSFQNYGQGSTAHLVCLRVVKLTSSTPTQSSLSTSSQRSFSHFAVPPDVGSAMLQWPRFSKPERPFDVIIRAKDGYCALAAPCLSPSHLRVPPNTFRDPLPAQSSLQVASSLLLIAKGTGSKVLPSCGQILDGTFVFSHVCWLLTALSPPSAALSPLGICRNMAARSCNMAARAVCLFLNTVFVWFGFFLSPLMFPGVGVACAKVVNLFFFFSIIFFSFRHLLSYMGLSADVSTPVIPSALISLGLFMRSVGGAAVAIMPGVRRRRQSTVTGQQAHNVFTLLSTISFCLLIESLVGRKRWFSGLVFDLHVWMCVCFVQRFKQAKAVLTDALLQVFDIQAHLCLTVLRKLCNHQCRLFWHARRSRIILSYSSLTKSNINLACMKTFRGCRFGIETRSIIYNLQLRMSKCFYSR